MGTRADFYIGTNPAFGGMKWIGSISCDGYESGLPSEVIKAKSEHEFANAVMDIKKEHPNIFISPEEGWPWPWNDSRTTDFAYAWGREYDWYENRDEEFDVPIREGAWVSVFGKPWRKPNTEEKSPPVAKFPDMRGSGNVNLAKSGLIIVEG